MGWRTRLLDVLGPGFAAGVTLGGWMQLLCENGFRVHPACWTKAASAALCGLINTPLAWLERCVYDRRVAATPVAPPLFVLGHFRNGTTHLHNLLALDRRFAYLKLSQVVAPHSMLLTQPIVLAVGRFALPRTRFGVDAMALRPDSPVEEESALGLMTGCSPYLGWMFPSRAEYYRRYLTFQGVSAAETDRWKAVYVRLVRKLSWGDGRPLVLKSPPNTCRIRLLLEIFPDARFVHVHRNPYAVYQSTLHLMTRVLKIHGFQRPKLDLHRHVVEQYQVMYDVFFDQRRPISAGRYCEVAFEDLEADPIGEMRRVYQELALPDFALVQPQLEQYVRSIAGYRKNQFPGLPAEVVSEISRVWRRCFDQWGYSRDGFSSQSCPERDLFDKTVRL